jgi:citrate synthase
MTMILAGLSAHLSSRARSIPAFTGSNLYEGSLSSIEIQIPNTISGLALVVSVTYCHRKQQAFTPPDPTLSFVANVFRMLGHPLSPTHLSCMEKLWMLYADHGMANATAAFLHSASTRADPMSCLIAALSAGYGPLHGGAIDMVYHMLSNVGTVENVPALIEEVKSGRESGKKLYGFGHRIYETEDPRARLIKQLLKEFETEELEIMKVAKEIERLASQDQWFESRKIRMNVDLYGCFVYTALYACPPFLLQAISSE